MKTFDLTVTRLLTLSQETVDDTLATGIEGGIGYWCHCAMPFAPGEDPASLTPKQVIEDVQSDLYRRFVEQEGIEFSHEVLTRGGTIRFITHEELEESDKIPSILTLDAFLEAMADYISEMRGTAMRFEDEDDLDFDADDVDTIIQRALWSELVYG